MVWVWSTLTSKDFKPTSVWQNRVGYSVSLLALRAMLSADGGDGKTCNCLRLVSILGQPVAKCMMAYLN